MHRLTVREYFVLCLAVALLFCATTQLVFLSKFRNSKGSWNDFDYAVFSEKARKIAPKLESVTTGDKYSAETHFEMLTGGGQILLWNIEANHQSLQPIDNLTSISGNFDSGISNVGDASESYPTIFGSKCSNYSSLGLPSSVRNYCGFNSAKSEADESPRRTTTHAARMEVADCERLTCYNLLTVSPDKDPTLLQAATMFMKLFPHRAPTDKELATVVTNFVGKASGDAVDEACQFWRKKYGFDNSPTTSPEELEFPLAFNIIAHEHVHQMARLLRAIYRSHNVYCIHVDAGSSDYFRSAVSSLVKCFDNVKLASRLEHVVYAGYSRSRADINCMEDHLNESSSGKTNWQYLFNTAGLAFPLRTNAELVKILRLYNGSNDIEGIYGRRVLRWRFEDEWTEDHDARKLMKTGKRNPPPPHDIDIVRGSAYGVFSRDFVKFIIEDRMARDLLEWSRRTWSPDEFFWSTLHHTFSNPHLRTPGAFSGYPSDKEWLAVYANWGETACHGKYVRGVCVFGVGDLPALTRRRELFANKLHSDFQPLALDCLEAWIRHKETCAPDLDHKFYSNLKFVRRRLEKWVRST